MVASGLHHVTIRVADLERSAAFYRDVLGFELEAPPVTDSPRYRFVVGQTLVVIRPPLPGTPTGDRFSERRIGVDHLAFTVDSHADLEQMLERLRAAAVATQGIQRHPWLPAEFICFRDPDNIQLEFYRDLPTG